MRPMWICAELIKFSTLMGSVGGWVFVVDVTSWERRKFQKKRKERKEKRKIKKRKEKKRKEKD